MSILAESEGHASIEVAILTLEICSSRHYQVLIF